MASTVYTFNNKNARVAFASRALLDSFDKLAVIEALEAGSGKLTFKLPDSSINICWRLRPGGPKSLRGIERLHKNFDERIRETLINGLSQHLRKAIANSPGTARPYEKTFDKDDDLFSQAGHHVGRKKDGHLSVGQFQFLNTGNAATKFPLERLPIHLFGQTVYLDNWHIPHLTSMCYYARRIAFPDIFLQHPTQAPSSADTWRGRADAPRNRRGHSR